MGSFGIGCPFWEIPIAGPLGGHWKDCHLFKFQLLWVSQILLLERDTLGQSKGPPLSGGFQTESETPSSDFLFLLLAMATPSRLRISLKITLGL